MSVSFSEDFLQSLPTFVHKGLYFLLLTLENRLVTVISLKDSNAKDLCFAITVHYVFRTEKNKKVENNTACHYY